MEILLRPGLHNLKRPSRSGTEGGVERYRPVGRSSRAGRVEMPAQPKRLLADERIGEVNHIDEVDRAEIARIKSGSCSDGRYGSGTCHPWEQAPSTSMT